MCIILLYLISVHIMFPMMLMIIIIMIAQSLLLLIVFPYHTVVYNSVVSMHFGHRRHVRHRGFERDRDSMHAQGIDISTYTRTFELINLPYIHTCVYLYRQCPREADRHHRAQRLARVR